MVVRTKEDADPMKALNRGYYVTSALVTVAFFFAARTLLNPAGAPDVWWHFFLCGLIGIATSIAFVFITQYYTEYRYRPVLGIADASQTGPATNIIAGIAVGMESTVMPVITMDSRMYNTVQMMRLMMIPNGMSRAGSFASSAAVETASNPM